MFEKAKDYIKRHVINILPDEDFMPYVEHRRLLKDEIWRLAKERTISYQDWDPVEKSVSDAKYYAKVKELANYDDFVYCNPMVLGKILVYESIAPKTAWAKERLITAIEEFEPYVKSLDAKAKKMVEDAVFKMCKIIFNTYPNPTPNYREIKRAIDRCYYETDRLMPIYTPLDKIMLSIAAVSLCLMITTAILGIPIVSVACTATIVSSFGIFCSTGKRPAAFLKTEMRAESCIHRPYP
jgi:hypothetical protein